MTHRGDGDLGPTDGFLSESPHVRSLRAFLQSKERHPVYAGHSYPKSPAALRVWVDALLNRVCPTVASLDPPSVVVAPHLDLIVEQQAYADAYAALRGAEPDRILLLGTGHEMTSGCFSLTHKSYVSPLGRMPCDREAVSALWEAGGELCEPHDLAHREEHALEFQLPFLQCVLARPDIPVVPLLCGSFYHWLPRVFSPADIPGMSAFLDVLRQLVTPRTLIVAGVDMAHIGRKFGHTQTGRALHTQTLAHDQRLLDALCAGDIQSFWLHNRAILDKFNVCGFSTLSVLMTAFPALRGRVVNHGFWFEDETESAVSFASVHLQ